MLKVWQKQNLMIKWEGEGDKERFKVVNYFRKKTPS